jgi:hypothetical protein
MKYAVRSLNLFPPSAGLRGLRAQIGESGIDALPDIYWLSLVDHIERRGRQIFSHATQLLAACAAA